MIATKIDNVYEVRFPDDIASFLNHMSAVITFGINLGLEATPLACVNLAGYALKLIFWICMPIVLVMAILLATAVWRFCRGHAVTLDSVLLVASPFVLQTLFVVYPIVSQIAFQAFSYHEFDDGSSWLRADASIEFGSAEHDRAVGVAILAILLYPIGLLVLFASLLARARGAIISGPPTPLSLATRFLHSEYTTTFFFWELFEMLRRFLLVGVLVMCEQGSLEQIAYGTLVALVYLTIQTIASPFAKSSDNFFASGCSLLLAILFVCSVFYKFSALTSLEDLQRVMSTGQKSDYRPPHMALTATILGTCVGAFVLLAMIIGCLATEEARRMRKEARAALARRLLTVKGGQEVQAPPIAENEFHLFLSHVWSTGAHERSESNQCPFLP